MKNTSIGILTAVSIFILTFVTSRHLFYAAVNAKFFFFIGFVSIVTIIFSYKIFKTKNSIPDIFKRHFLLMGLLFIAIYIISSFLGVSVAQSFWSDILRSTGVFFLIAVGVLSFVLSEFLTEKDWSTVRKSVALSGGIFSIFTIIGVDGFGATGRFLWTNLGIPGFTFGNTTFAGAFLLLALILSAIELTRTPKHSKWRITLIGVCIVNVLSPLLLNIGIFLGKVPISELISNPEIILGNARASSATTILMGLFLLGQVLIKKYIPEAKRKVLSFSWRGIWAIGVMAGVVLLFTAGSFVQEAYSKQSTGARLIVWDIGLEAFKEKPIFGWGPQNFDQAFERHFDNRLYLSENLGETWFDRAHNIVVDTLVEVGILGMIINLILIVWFLFVVRKAKNSELIQESEWLLLSIFPFAHFLQLQTGFDTVGSYALVALFLGYGLWLERKMIENTTTSSSSIISKPIAVILLLLALFGSYCLVFREYSRQRAILTPFITLNQDKQEGGIKRALSRTSSFETLRLLSSSFIKGSLEEIAKSGGDPKVIEATISRSKIYENAFVDFLEVYPENYRARMNYAYLLLIQGTLGEDKIKIAQDTIEESYKLSRNNPLTFAMHSLSFLYQGNLQEAKRLAQAGIDLNTEIEFSRSILSHIEAQESKFPAISVLRLENI